MTVAQNQTFLDVVIMGAGTLEAAFEVAAANGMSVSDQPVVGANITLPGITTDADTLNYLQMAKANIGTGAGSKIYIGIGYWKIEKDFIVS